MKQNINKLLRRWEILEPLANADFVRLWVANGLWWQAMWMEMLITGWLVLELTDSAWWVAVIGFYRSIPLLFIGPIGSMVTDRYLRRRLLVLFQTSNALGVLVLTLFFWSGWLSYWHIAIFSLLRGCLWALDWPTRRAIVPDLVGKERVVDAMVLENVVQNITRIAGPLGAGFAVERMGIMGALVILSVVAVASALVLVGIRSDSRAPVGGGGVTEALAKTREGWNFVRGHRRIWGVFLITIFMNFWAFPYMSLLPVFARDILGQGAAGLGWLGAAHGVGATLGLFLVNWGRRHWGNEWLFTAGSLLLCLGLVAFSTSTSYGLSLLLLMCSGLGQAGFSIMQSSIILVEAPDDMRGRAMGALVLAIGAGPMGRLQSGAMAEWWGAPLAVGGMAGWAALLTLVLVLYSGEFLGSRAKRH